MSDLSDFSRTTPQLETVDVQSIPTGIEPGSGSARMKFGEAAPRKKNIPKGLWTKCGKCAELIYDKDLEENLKTCPSCGYHFPIAARVRLASLVDEKSFKEMDAGMSSVDVLKFTGVASYPSKLERYQKSTGENDAVITGLCKMGPHKVALGIMDFSFLGGSMGSVVGEKLTRLIEVGTRNKLSVIIISTS
ncbi:MAG: acetyl-CoA carboxylase carboxyl transferase subunit beta, partial [Pedosphaera sp.]|nr:acetyl-CoA carboxylase carboxyl transferase subunit beta [Pedosphaera sp.]